MSPDETIAEAVKLLEQLTEILQAEGGSQYVPAVSSVINCLRDPTRAAEAKLADAKISYTSMMEQKFGLPEWGISRENVADRIAENKKLYTLEDELWKLLGRGL